MSLKTQYNQSKRTICPHCKGTKTDMKRDFKGHTTGMETSDIKCEVCEGEGIVNMQITYTPI